jgi:F-type H+-transporting ATPase subunit a
MASEKLDPLKEVVDSNQIHFEIGGAHLDLPGPSWLFPHGFTKFMLFETIAFILLLAVFIPLARRITTRGEPRGRLWALCESLLIFIRDQVARPAIGEHDYRRFLPFLWTTFLFILVLNVMGMIPFMGSATASLAVTGVLAIIAFLVIHINGIIANHGFIGYLKTFVPPLEMNDPIMKILGPPIMVMMFFIEILAAFIKGVVLAIRLFANMLAGHVVLFVILSFIHQVGHAANEGSQAAEIFFWPLAIVCVVMDTMLSLLELFIALLQAYVFTFLTAVFLGMAMHPEH